MKVDTGGGTGSGRDGAGRTRAGRGGGRAIVQEVPALPRASAKAPKNKVGPELNGLDGRNSGTSPATTIPTANKNSGITWNEAASRTTSRIRAPRFPAPR